MTIDEHIHHVAKEKKRFTVSDVLDAIQHKYTRQYISKKLQQMVKKGVYIRGGTTKGAVYTLPEYSYLVGNTIHQTVQNNSLDEDTILKETQRKLIGFQQLHENIQALFSYAFTEMVNNAIEHSSSSTIDIEAFLSDEMVGFRVVDTGIGVFESIRKDRAYEKEIDALQDLLKGKATTQPDMHSGEGIFFTSKTADLFLLESHELRLRVDNLLPDVFVQNNSSFLHGTTVQWQVSIHTKRTIQEIFQAFQSDSHSYAFDKTDVLIRLYAMDTEYISRSQARRVLVGLEKFKKITLDFENISTIGQGFADEVFRVFANNHPDIEVSSVNTSESVDYMIHHIQK